MEKPLSIFSQFDRIPEHIIWKKPYFLIGLTGSMASGKSTASQYFREKGWKVMDADTIAKKTYKKSKIKKILIEKFGKDIYHVNGEVNTKLVASMIFSDRERLSWIQSLLHPEVFRILKFCVKKTKSGEIVVLDIPLLFESDADKEFDFDLTVVIDAPVELRRKRAYTRGWTDEEFSQRENHQLPPEKKRNLSSCVIWNNEDLGSFYKKLEYIVEKINISKPQHRG